MLMRSRTPLALLIVLTVLLVACGGDPSDALLGHGMPADDVTVGLDGGGVGGGDDTEPRASRSARTCAGCAADR